MSAIVVDSLSKQFNGKRAVDGIQFQVEKGSIYGFLGPNGAGKTTTINILCTLLKPTSGKAFVNGYDCEKQPDLVRRSIGIVFQDTTLDKDLTAYENLLYHAILYRVSREKRAGTVNQALAFVGLSERKHDLVKRFSGGMKRRLEVARALVHQPEILFLDEPTLGLDPQSRENLWSYVRTLPKERGITVFMTTHYMDEAEVCDKIGIIDHGKIIASGSPGELKSGIGGDVIYLRTRDNEKALQEVGTYLGINAALDGDELYFSVENAESSIPRVIRTLGNDVLSVRLQRPTLNDVFLKLTGRRIRESGMDGMDNLREDIRAYRRKHDR
ncbi:MAG: ATP-binding cassette domain-containing protein [bacterium]